MMSFPERSRVWVVGSRLAGAAGSGICLTQTTTFMADHLCGIGPGHAIPPGDRRFPSGTWPSAATPALGPSRPPERRPSGLVACRDGQGSAQRVGDHGVHPQLHHGRRSSGPLTVQVLTARPRAWARSTSSAVTASTKGCTARNPAAAASSSPRPGSAAEAPQGARAPAARPPPAPPAGWPAGRTRRSPGRSSRRSSIASAVGGGDHLGGVPPGVGRRVLDLHVDRHAVADGQDVGQQGHVAGSSATPSSGMTPTPGTSASWWTASAPSLVRRTSSSTPSAPRRRASAKASTVFSSEAALGTTPMCKNGRHCILPAMVARAPRRRAGTNAASRGSEKARKTACRQAMSGSSVFVP